MITHSNEVSKARKISLSFNQCTHRDLVRWFQGGEWINPRTQVARGLFQNQLVSSVRQQHLRGSWTKTGTCA